MPINTNQQTSIAPKRPFTQPHVSSRKPGPTPDQLNTLLKAGPNWSSPPKAADQARRAPEAPTLPPLPTVSSSPEAVAKQKLNELNALLSESNINTIMREPEAVASRKILEKIRTMLTPATLGTLLSGPHAHTNAQAVEAMGTRLSDDHINTCQTAAMLEASTQLIEQLEIKGMQDILGASNDDGLENFVQCIHHWQSAVQNLTHNYAEMDTTTHSLAEFGKLLTKDKLDAMRTTATESESTTASSSGMPLTYRFNSLNESSLDAPLEVRNFRREDTLDLSGIRSRLNAPLQQVEHFTGASAQMQINYLPSTNTTVIAIAGQPDDQHFVLKVFGEVRPDNIVT